MYLFHETHYKYIKYLDIKIYLCVYLNECMYLCSLCTLKRPGHLDDILYGKSLFQEKFKISQIATKSIDLLLSHLTGYHVCLTTLFVS